MISLLAAVVLPAQLAAALPPDSVDRLRAQARTAEARFERLARNMAPVTWGGFDGRNCDEIVGRFCLRFDSTSTRPTGAEVGRVIDERRDAVETLRRYFAAAPGERAAAGPLVRLLVLDDRASEAVPAALAFAALTTDTLWGHLLLGFAYNAAGRVAEAEREFVHALARMEARTRRDWTDPQWLVHGDEMRRVGRLDPSARADYERRFWIVSDPLWLTDANERWVEHMARHVAARLMERVPVVAGMLRWGRDLDQLTVRYGTPSARSQIRGNQPWDQSTFVEYFDTAQRAYSPERWLSAGMPAPPRPGERPHLYAARARSGYALRTVHRLVELPHQVTRFLAGDEVVVRVDGALLRSDHRAQAAAAETEAEDASTDPAAASAAPATSRPRVGLFAYDSAFTRRVQTVRTAEPWPTDSDTLQFSLSVRAPPGAIVYSVEALDTAAAYAARARYALDAFIPDDGPIVSDLLVGRPFGERLPDRRTDPALQPLPSLVMPAGATLGLYAEVYRLTGAGPESLRLELALEPADGPITLGQIARWIGRVVGIGGEPTDPSVAWQQEVEEGVHPIALNLPLDPERTGRHVLILRVTDLRTGMTAETRREILLR